MDSAFEVHMLNDEGKKKAQTMAEMFNGLMESTANMIGTDPATARYIAIVRTKLEEACFFAKKGLAVNPTNQQQ